MSSSTLQTNQLDIWLAAKMGIFHRVQYLVCQDEHCINEIDRYNNTPIYYAAYAGHFEIVYFLLKHGAIYDDRTILSALNTDIQRLLRLGNTFSKSLNTSFPSPKTINSFQGEGIGRVFENLYEHHVRRERVSILQANGTPETKFFLREDYSDFCIVITDEQTKTSEIFHVHLLVLVSRWKKFRKEYVAKITQNFLKGLETKSEYMKEEEKTNFWHSAFIEKMLLIDENMHNLKGKKMSLAGIDPELFHALLKYLYTLKFGSSVKSYLDSILQADSLAVVIPKVLQTIRNLGLSDILQTEVYFYCKSIDASFAIEKANKDLSYMVYQHFDFVKRGKDEIQQALKSVSAKWNVCVKDWYDLLDKTVRIMCCKACSDIILYTENQDQESKFYCHKSVLVHSNHYFRTLLLGNFAEAEQLNDDSNIQSIAQLEIEPAFPSSLKIVLEHIYFGQLIDCKPYSLQELINTLIMAQKYDEYLLVEKISDALSFRAGYANIFKLYELGSNICVPSLMESLEKRIETYYSSPTTFNIRSALSTIEELQKINATHLITTVEMKGIEYIKNTVYLPFNHNVFKNETVSIRVEKIIKRKWYRIIHDEEVTSEDALIDTFSKTECPFCNEQACSSSMFSHFAFYCVAFKNIRRQLIIYSRDRIRSAIQDIYLPNDKTFWEPWFLPYSIHLLEIDDIVTKPLQSISRFLIIEKELGVLGFMPKDCIKNLQHYFNADLLYQKQIDRIQRYITSSFLPSLFAEIDAKLCVK